MKTIGLLGGMSWESTTEYYKVINRTVRDVLGGLHSAKCCLYSVDFQEIELCQANGQWERSAQILTEAARALERAGADFIVICTNTMHKVAPQISAGISVPLLHIAEVTADELEAKKINTVALLGTRYTMEQDFYKQRLIDRGFRVIIPEKEDRELINRVIYDELCVGKILPESKSAYLNILEKMQQQGAQGAILGCTEIGLLIQQEDCTLPLFDTSYIHAHRAALLAIKEDIQE